MSTSRKLSTHMRGKEGAFSCFVHFAEKQEDSGVFSTHSLLTPFLFLPKSGGSSRYHLFYTGFYGKSTYISTIPFVKNVKSSFCTKNFCELMSISLFLCYNGLNTILIWQSLFDPPRSPWSRRNSTINQNIIMHIRRRSPRTFLSPALPGAARRIAGELSGALLCIISISQGRSKK